MVDAPLAGKCFFVLLVAVVSFCVTKISSAPAELHDYYPQLVAKAAECIAPCDQQHPTVPDHQPVPAPRGPSHSDTQDNCTSTSSSSRLYPAGSGDSLVGQSAPITTDIPRTLATPVGKETSSTNDSAVEVSRVADVTFWTGQEGRGGQPHAGPTTEDPAQGKTEMPTDQATQGTLAQHTSQQGGQEGSVGKDNKVNQSEQVNQGTEVTPGSQVHERDRTSGKSEASPVSNTGVWPAPTTSPGVENVFGPCSSTKGCSAGIGGTNVIITSTTTTTTTSTTTNGFDSAVVESDTTTPDTEIPQDPSARREYMRKVKENATASPSDLSLPDVAGISNASDDQTIVDTPSEHVDGLDLRYGVTDSRSGDSSITIATPTDGAAFGGKSFVNESGSASSGGSGSRVNRTDVSGSVGSDGLHSGSRVSGTFSTGSSGNERHLSSNGSGNMLPSPEDTFSMIPSDPDERRRYLQRVRSKTPSDPFSRKVFVMLRDGLIPSDPTQRKRFLENHLNL
ncbi:uncharacterized protein DDB_G0271670-like isoform X3 [Pomacea canaliculata]|uniref:uncharacterized protein DDB_G0271670-like isoform X3 n=1 Tax=Pomacea canaliculata TaxID=400727 RepID=UPI000D73797A|nr:uncharacterized protein DDB_G0271670-like isoform X3 [Pomacea canaliculata]